MAATASSDGHTRKRQFQPSITSYLHTHDGKTSSLRRTTSPLSPPLPEETQASLLSVGMRVRKSVPEGYKNKPLGEPGFPFPSTAPPAPLSTAYTSSESSEGPRELTPFCGLHKTGGLSPSSSAPATFRRGEVEGSRHVPTMTWSQSTVPSTQNSFISTYTTDKKRTYEDEIEDDMDAYFEEVEAETLDEARMSETLHRPIARMKHQVRKVVADGGPPVVKATDFDEAAFLAPLEGMEMDDF